VKRPGIRAALRRKRLEVFERARRRAAPLATRIVLEEQIRRTNDGASVVWLGRRVWQMPLDAWLIQEVVSELRPNLIVETGTWEGGSALYLASICDLLGTGEIISIDVAARATPEHPRVSYIAGSSTDEAVVEQVRRRVSVAGVVLVILDSDHTASHVEQELRLYGPFVTPGSYVHVQDGVIDELAIVGPGPGPKVAVERFLASPEGKRCKRDVELERRYVMTAHPLGWLKRV